MYPPYWVSCEYKNSRHKNSEEKRKTKEKIMDKKVFEKLEKEENMMLDNESTELDPEKIQKVFDTNSQRFKEVAEWLHSLTKNSTEDDDESPDDAERECDLYEALGVESNEDIEEKLEDIAGGEYDED